MTCNLVCEIKIRRWITPVLVIACLTKWDWLLMKCISMKIKTVPTEAWHYRRHSLSAIDNAEL